MYTLAFLPDPDASSGSIGVISPHLYLFSVRCSHHHTSHKCVVSAQVFRVHLHAYGEQSHRLIGDIDGVKAYLLKATQSYVNVHFVLVARPVVCQSVGNENFS